MWKTKLFFPKIIRYPTLNIRKSERSKPRNFNPKFLSEIVIDLNDNFLYRKKKRKKNNEI